MRRDFSSMRGRINVGFGIALSPRQTVLVGKSRLSRSRELRGWNITELYHPGGNGLKHPGNLFPRKNTIVTVERTKGMEHHRAVSPGWQWFETPGPRDVLIVA